MAFVRFILRNLARGIVTTAVLLLATSAVGLSQKTDVELSDLVRGGIVRADTVLDQLPGIIQSGMTYEPNYVGIVNGEFIRADASGTPVESITDTGNAELDAAVERLIVDVTGTDDDALRRAYDYIRAVPYQTMSHVPEQEWLSWQEWGPEIALQLFDLNEANCYRYAAAMTYVAIGLGYDAQLRVGYASHNLVEHAWCEITLPNGDVRVIDCSLGNDHAYPDLDWCMVTYADAGVWYYDPFYEQYE